MSTFPPRNGAPAANRLANEADDADARLRDTSGLTSRLRRRLQIPLTVLGALLLLAAGAVIATPRTETTGTMLGASGAVSGGIARINGVIPLETDGWLPAARSTIFTEPARDGTHRVRIILELTALDPAGIDYDAENFTIEGWGSGTSRLVWAEPTSAVLAQGEVVTATQVFEIPNLAIELTLRANQSRFALGTGHHTR